MEAIRCGVTASTASSVSSASHITRYECRCRTSVFEALSDQIKTADDNGSGRTGIADVVLNTDERRLRPHHRVVIFHYR